MKSGSRSSRSAVSRFWTSPKKRRSSEGRPKPPARERVGPIRFGSASPRHGAVVPVPLAGIGRRFYARWRSAAGSCRSGRLIRTAGAARLGRGASRRARPREACAWPMKSWTSALASTGCSTCGTWPHCSSTTCLALGQRVADVAREGERDERVLVCPRRTAPAARAPPAACRSPWGPSAPRGRCGERPRGTPPARSPSGRCGGTPRPRRRRPRGGGARAGRTCSRTAGGPGRRRRCGGWRRARAAAASPGARSAGACARPSTDRAG